MKIKYRRNNDTQFFLVWMAGHVILPLTRPMYMGKGINLENRKGKMVENARTFSWGKTGEVGNIGRWPVVRAWRDWK